MATGNNLGASVTISTKCRTAAMVLLAAGFLAYAPMAPSQENKSSTAWPKGRYAELDKLPDWGGIWTLQFVPPSQRERPVLKGEYLKKYEEWRKQVEENHGMVPREASNCRPPGMPGIMSVGQYPIEFLFTPGRVTTHHEAWMFWRIIFTDGRGHPEDLEASFAGHSIGRWEGETLVVDTVGIKDSLELMAGMRHSNKMRITERIYLSKEDPDTLIVDMVVEDPEALAKPWHNRLTFRRQRDAELIEFVCTENDRNPIDASGHTTFESTSQ